MINIFLFQSAVWRACVCTIIKVVLSQCSIAAANICGAKERKLLFKFSRSRNKISKCILD